SDSEKNMSAYADQNHAPSLTCVRLEYAVIIPGRRETAVILPKMLRRMRVRQVEYMLEKEYRSIIVGGRLLV
ncbi:hypothetical protein, partial [uncultured Eubacterium sp.]|uniref:hypothetical protein n=1 Tax=uncultured Eubacterium sp. TaxID=165185 RepID=UPI00259A2898